MASAPPLRNVPCVLIVRDGWGQSPHRDRDATNAIARAAKPCDDMLVREWPRTLIRTSGEDVGLPVGPEGPVMGNSEVGHQNIGAGRIVDQELMRITNAIRRGDLATHPVLLGAVAHAKRTGGSVHLLGLVSDGQVHSDLAHLLSLVDFARGAGVEAGRLWIHAITDGRDTAPTSAPKYLRTLEAHLAQTGLGAVATVVGRFYAMDRDHRWERVKAAYDALVRPGDRTAPTALAAVEGYYAAPSDASRGGDEFVLPTQVGSAATIARSRIRAGDAVVFFNFRGDRPREITKAFVLDDAAWAKVEKGGFDRGARIGDLYFATLAEYETGLPVEVVFRRPPKMKNILGEWLSAHGVRQFRCAETEKFPHVTFFFNDYREEPFEGETREIVPSPKEVATYDLKPEMSAHGVRDAVLRRLAAADCEPVIIVNFANGDMVGHTGSLSATTSAVETVDACVGAIVAAALARGGSAVVTADHGNAEEMWDARANCPHTAHTNYTVPCSVVGEAFRGRKLRGDGRLGDLAPTVLEMIGLAQPAEMTGKSLLA
ncbi:MAG: 2,3-bisphosphoglycerate-independent phosphoglycerate mutase [Planctomycetaceae bacterium]|nr:2,3-bisphosphoglycerate-independent phosphoglycerate mutase [Planctomycetaceae bacterium]